MSKIITNKLWLYLIFILLFVFYSGGIIFNQYFKEQSYRLYANAEKDINFISTLIKKNLQSNNYQLAKDFLIEWSENSPNILESTLTPTNKTESAHYKSNLTSKNSITIYKSFTYSNDREAKIIIKKNTDLFHEQFNVALYSLLTFYLIIAIISIYVTYSIININKKKNELILKNTQRLQAEKKLINALTILQEREENLAITLNSICDGVIVTDNKGNITRMNPVAEKLTGWFLSEARGKPLTEVFCIIDSSTREPIETQTDKIMSLNKAAFRDENIILISKNSEEYYITDSASPIKKDNNTNLGVIIVFNNITEHKKREEKILYQSHFDSLTDLPNRFLSLDRLLQLVTNAQRKEECVCALFIDLDNFKTINDSLGHDMGDKLLIEAASRLSGNIRSEDTVGRFGGDEFIILLSGLDHATDALVVIEKLLNLFRLPFDIENRKLILTISIGISVYPDDGITPAELLRKADSAMHHSKEKGRNTYSFFNDSMNKDASRRLLLEEEMHGALERGEFRLNYQPKINISNNEIIGVESLIRWSNKKLGEVSPVEFIPVAEQSGMIIPIGKFVLIESLKMMSKWKKIYAQNFSIAVNLSPCQFRDDNLINIIKNNLIKFEISTDSLELEITEGVLLNKHNYVDIALKEIHDLGIRIAMDDFGTGYSSLSYLRSYPFDILKIDRSFVSDITEDNADRELVNASISMAHSLGLKVVAEGVETVEQLNLLATQGCDIAQGYYFSKPVSAEEITAMLKKDK